MFGRDFPGANTLGVDASKSFAGKKRAALEIAATLAGMRVAERRTALLILSALVRSECDVSTLRTAYRDIADAKVIPLVTELRLHCDCTFRHSLRTMKTVALIVRRLGIARQEHASICVGALLHDIGKLAIPADILRLPRALRPAEIEIVRRHAEVGYESICDKRVFGWNAVLDIVRHHHERLDGSGYPEGLDAQRISLRTRCVSVGDVYSALTENRPYRAALSRESAFRILSDLVAAGKLDGDVVGALGEGLALPARR